MMEIKFRAFHKKSEKYHFNLIMFGNEICEVYYGALEYITDRYEPAEQYTGLLDRNGAPIYKGDIVKWRAWVYEVFFDREKSSFRIKRPSETGPIRTACQIIGNINENPELLK